MNQDHKIIPVFTFFEILRVHNEFQLGLNEYFSLIEVLQLDNTYLESPKRLRELCRLLWLKPGQSEVLFLKLFKDSFKDITLNSSIKQKESEDVQDDNKTEKQQAPVDYEGNEGNDVVPEETEKPIETEENIEKQSEQKLQSLFLNIIEKHSGEERKVDKKEILSPYEFHFKEFYPGINYRSLKQQWKFLQIPFYRGRTNEIDVQETINTYTLNGYMTNPEYTKPKANKAKVLCLIDHRDSMVAFKVLGELLVTTAKEILLKGSSHYYFSGLPSKFKRTDNQYGYYIYSNIAHTKYTDLIKEIDKYKFKNEDLSILIFSDAGAAKRNFNIKKIDATKELIQELRKATNKIGWLNPMLEDRWEDTSASIIQDYVFMKEASIRGIKEIIDLFRGKISFENMQLH